MYYTISMIGIFGGAFDPPHTEHIRIARDIAREFHLDKVVFLPSGNSPHKRLETPFPVRLEMLRAVCGNEFEIETMEGDFPERAYSYRILPILKEKYGEIAFVIGGDSLLALDRWRNPDLIMKVCPLIVIPRGDEEMEVLRAKARECEAKWGGRILLSDEVRGGNVSSTILRAKVSLGMETPELDQRVKEIVDRHSLYSDYRETAEKVKAYLTPKRWKHTCGVVIAGLKINQKLALPDHKVILACLLHDCMKYADRVNPGVPEDVVGSKVLHAFNGAEEARIAFGITDSEILDAIRYHTTGRAGMTPLDKLVYTADMVEEETRDFEGVEELRRVAYRDLDEGFRLCFKQCYDLLLEDGKPIYHLTIDCYNELFKGE